MTMASQSRVRPLTRQQSEQVQAWTALALERMPYMATMLFNLRFVDAPGLGTFAVDGRYRCYIDFDAVASRGPAYCGQALLHECSHLFADHATFAEDMGVDRAMRQVWNVAADAAINDDLRDGGCEMFDNANPYGHVLPSTLGEPDHRTPHHYFRALHTLLDNPDAQVGRGPGDVGTHGQADAVGQGGGWAGCGSGSGGAPAPCELGEGDDLTGAAPPATTAERERVRVAVAVSIREAAAKARGTVPGGLVENADLVLTPAQVPWQQVLGRVLRGAVRARAGTMSESYQRRNRRRHDARVLTSDGRGRRVVLPALMDPVPRVHVVRDTSGSMSEADLSAVTSEIVGIARRLRVRGDDLVIADVDAAVHDTRRYRRPSGLAEVSGRGGTDMRTGIDHALRAQPRPSVIVVMTDGETPWPSQQTSCVPVVAAIVHPSPEHVVAKVPDWIRTVVVPATKE
ncbi:VWA-like domain-containing protein [Promicromonospora sp. NPDC057138]|uniref:vWA domain-containing protein n=1 Tax=Promicromonospora sp. NPDC057138 TaxID=3346031 RepID=UPI0036367F5D